MPPDSLSTGAVSFKRVLGGDQTVLSLPESSRREEARGHSDNEMRDLLGDGVAGLRDCNPVLRLALSIHYDFLRLSLDRKNL